MDQIEKYIMTRLYKYVFCPETTDDEKKDLAIQKRIRQLVVLLFLVVFTTSCWKNTSEKTGPLSFRPWVPVTAKVSAILSM